MAPLSLGFHKLLSFTVTTVAIFPSWMYLLGGDDNCMLSVPSSTYDLHIWCWQCGEICQAIAAAACTLFNYALSSLSQMRMISFLLCIANLPTCHLLLDSRLLGLTLRPSAPVFQCHRDSLTRGRLALAQEAVRVSPSLSPRFFCSC